MPGSYIFLSSGSLSRPLKGQEKEGRDSLGPIIISCGPKTSLPQVPNEYRLSGGIRELVNGLTVRPWAPFLSLVGAQLLVLPVGRWSLARLYQKYNCVRESKYLIVGR